MSLIPDGGLLPRELVRLDAKVTDKADAIRQATALLVAAGCVRAGFDASMERREAASNTYLGRGIAIPHGMVEDRDMILRDGIAVLQVRDGVAWNDGQRAQLVVAIAARSDAHIGILRRLTRLMQDQPRVAMLAATDDPQAIIAALEDAPEVLAAEPATDFAQGFEWVCDYPNGLHARPATEWAETARRFAARIRVRSGTEIADARNMISLLQLGLAAGQPVVISADGADAADALSTLRVVITGLSAREKADALKAEEKRNATATAGGWTPAGPADVVEGVAASPGLAIGVLHHLEAGPMVVPDQPTDLGQAADQLHNALARAREQLRALADDTARRLGAADAGIFRAQSELLNDPQLITTASQKLVEGHGLAWSWHQAVQDTAGQLTALGNPVLAARAVDLRDVGQRVLALIDPALAKPAPARMPKGAILIADDLTPTDTAGLDGDVVAGLVTAQGGPTSHTAILARTLGLPAVVGAGAALARLATGAQAIIDGSGGRLYLNPSEADLTSARAWIAAEEEKRIRAAESRAQPATTRDGHQIAIGANINLAEQAAFAIEQGAEGVGLMRTEFLFLERGDSPTEEDQYRAYSDMARAMGDRPLIIRALDIGGDKQVSYLDLPREENPFLGVRGARLLLRRPELLVPQVRALYRAARDGARIQVMFPMITSVAELIRLRETCEQIRAELDAPAIPLGIMIEVPSAALLADRLAEHADFFSIGTNDLTQYALAIDRQNPVLAPEADSLHPAVLGLIDLTVRGAHAKGRWVGVCGGIAGDAFGAALLTGLGVDELSMTPRDIPAVKERIRNADLSELQALAQRALMAQDAASVRALETTT
ncbi:phosphoenolpyruvate--protein phosphotransferase [Paracoccus laeviglucosivorans]|uniref:phosphoenolpyruvate--protein phosphotransferase n=1 Tax=Paracoccus laeviglucosivorans TaxID=1197861 RepID=A0A521F5Y0_9RHOB|nr:phosphoenolpyruvate--protein phosphotransferase [Paracoccus laeviglucosivorans]SMO91618.1 Phosphocarrier protein HPr /phosphoenolpyruvate--protein phosphotransferase /PTS system D-fructose-specific IIA component (F1P-forming), Frc family [Paracoccus laeviglucosivorans]